MEKYPLLGTHFILDEEKILRENQWNLEKIYETIDEIAKHSGMIKIDKNTYHCKGNEWDLDCLGVFIHKHLMKYKWFTLNVKEWTWLSEDEGDSDMISFCKEVNRGVWQ